MGVRHIAVISFIAISQHYFRNCRGTQPRRGCDDHGDGPALIIADRGEVLG
jgi:hypothetical protein